MNIKVKQIIYTSKENNFNNDNNIWLLKSAIKNPECVIVSSSGVHSNYMSDSYKKLLKEEPISKQLFWYMFGRKTPIFVTLDYLKFDILRNLPILFDNSCLI